jgi:hypothetical protein
MKVIDSMINFIETYNNQIKDSKAIIKENSVENSSVVIFNTTFYGFNYLGSKVSNKNQFEKYFDENNRLNRLVDLFKLLILQPVSSAHQKIIENLSISVCYLLKGKRPQPYCGCVLEYIFDVISNNNSSAAKNAWNEITDVDEWLALKQGFFLLL